MKFTKLNTLYHYKVDFGTKVKLESLVLHFDREQIAAYKVLVRAIAEDEIVFHRLFDENAFTQAADKAHNTDVQQYFKTDLSALNCLQMKLSHFTGRELKL